MHYIGTSVGVLVVINIPWGWHLWSMIYIKGELIDHDNSAIS